MRFGPAVSFFQSGWEKREINANQLFRLDGIPRNVLLRILVQVPIVLDCIRMREKRICFFFCVALGDISIGLCRSANTLWSKVFILRIKARSKRCCRGFMSRESLDGAPDVLANRRSLFEAMRIGTFWRGRLFATLQAKSTQYFSLSRSVSFCRADGCVGNINVSVKHREATANGPRGESRRNARHTRDF